MTPEGGGEAIQRLIFVYLLSTVMMANKKHGTPSSTCDLRLPNCLTKELTLVTSQTK